MSEVGGSNLARPPPLGPIRHTLKRHRPFPCSDPTFAPPPELRHLLDPERKIAAEAAAGPGEPKEESIFAKLHVLSSLLFAVNSICCVFFLRMGALRLAFVCDRCARSASASPSKTELRAVY